ncbi:MAG TPA: hypothetical protein V6C69_11045 [Trichormus sp.]|jgi:serine/threonine protein kinase
MQEKLNRPEQMTAARTFWPSPQDYNEAVQTPAGSFADEELRQGQAETTALGLPRSVSGSFASVFCFDCADRKVAVRCFLHNIPDQQQRYHAISQYVQSDDLACTVPFEYLEKGIRIHGDWYPILKMEWVEGLTLKQFIEAHVDNSMALSLLASYFKEMTLTLTRHGIAHGDLQHDNIMISCDELRLVDYDGMYVPALSGGQSIELGQPNYQHPERSSSDFGPHLDNFSSWVIYTSLKALSRDPSLWRQLNADGECLLFRRSDFEHRATSQAFSLLCNHSDVHVRSCARQLFEFAEGSLNAVPSLDCSLESSSLKGMLEWSKRNFLAPLAVSDVKGDGGPGSRPAKLPVWIDDQNGAGGSARNHAGVKPQLPAIPPVSLFGRLTDPRNPQYTLIRIDPDIFVTPADLPAEIRRQLAPGEGLYWSGMLMPTCNITSIDIVVWRLSAFTIFVLVGLQLHVNLVLLLSLLSATLLFPAKVFPLGGHAIALTNHRVIVIARQDADTVKTVTMPLNEIDSVKILPIKPKAVNAVIVIKLKPSNSTPSATHVTGNRYVLKQFIDKLPPRVAVEGKL